MTVQVNRTWERQEDENENQYGLFKLFLEYRDIETTIRMFNSPAEPEAFKRYVERTKREKKWDRRVREYDNYIAANRSDAHAKIVQTEVIEIGKRRIALLTRLYDRILKAEEKLGDDPSPRDLRTFSATIRELDDMWARLEKTTNGIANAQSEIMERQVATAKDAILEKLRKITEQQQAQKDSGSQIIQ